MQPVEQEHQVVGVGDSAFVVLVDHLPGPYRLFYKSQQVHYYTREGKTGDQVMLRGNRAIAEHQADGTALRLFVAVGNRPGSGTRIHQYVGQFAVDPERPYVVRRAPGC